LRESADAHSANAESARTDRPWRRRLSARRCIPIIVSPVNNHETCARQLILLRTSMCRAHGVLADRLLVAETRENASGYAGRAQRMHNEICVSVDQNNPQFSM